MMAFMGTLPMIGRMVGVPNAVVGFLVHMVISAGIGGGFGLVLGIAYSRGENCLVLKVGQAGDREPQEKPNLHSVG